MGNYVIATSSTCDIEREWLDAHHVPVISYSFEIDGQIYKDDCREATRRRFYSTMREGKLPNTSQINSYAYYEFFKDLIEDGEAVVFVDMDRAISNSYANSLAAADMIRDEYPDAQLYIMDTSCITMGLAFLIKKLHGLPNFVNDHFSGNPVYGRTPHRLIQSRGRHCSDPGACLYFQSPRFLASLRSFLN